MKKSFFAIMVIVVLLSIGVACAADNQTDAGENAVGQEIYELSADGNVLESVGGDTEIPVDENVLDSVDDEALSENDEQVDVLGDTIYPGSITIDSIQDAVNSAKNGDTIELDGTYVNGESEDAVTVNKSVTFVGKNDATFDSPYSMVYVVADNVVFKNIKFKGTSGYAAALSDCKKVSFINCSFIDDKHDTFIAGYRIIIEGSEASFVNCSFNNNKAGKEYRDAVIIIGKSEKSQSKVSFKNSEFKNNSGFSTIFVTDNSTCILNECSFKGNSKLAGATIFNEYILKIIKNGKTTTYSAKTIDKWCVFTDSLTRYPFLKCKPSYTSTSYNSGKKLSVKFYSYITNKQISIGDLEYFDITNGGKVKSYDAFLVREFDISTLKLGTHKATFRYWTDYSLYVTPDTCKIYSFSVKITKAKTKVKAPKVVGKLGQSKYFKITVKHSVSKKAVKKLKLKVKVYTGKKAKTYVIKTNKKGIAKFNTKKLKRGLHKVVILSANKNYIVSKKSSIKIK